MDPVEPELNTGIESPAPENPVAAQGPLTFTPDQEVALFGGPAEPGQSYTVTVRAGEPGPDGQISFEVVADSPPAESPMEGHEPASPEDDIAEDSAEVTEALGYDRGALLKGRAKRGVPKLSAKDLEED